MCLVIETGKDFYHHVVDSFKLPILKTHLFALENQAVAFIPLHAPKITSSPVGIIAVLLQTTRFDTVTIDVAPISVWVTPRVVRWISFFNHTKLVILDVSMFANVVIFEIVAHSLINNFSFEEISIKCLNFESVTNFYLCFLHLVETPLLLN